MNNPLQKLHTEASHIRLSSAEKRAMYARIAQAMRPSASAPRQTPGFYYLFMPQFALPMAALLVVILGGGTAFAAQGSLPGQPLYAMKTKVNEPIQGALAFSVEDKIKFHTEVAQTRVEEAEVLASEDKLDLASSQEIEKSIDAHIAVRDSLTQKLEAAHPEAAQPLLALIDISIDAHSDVLEALGQSSKNENTKERSGAIAMRARSSSRHDAQAGPALAMAKASAPVAPAMATTMAFSADDMQATGSSSAPENVSRTAESPKETTSKSWKRGDSAKEAPKQSSEERRALALAQRATTSLEVLRAQANKLASSTLDEQGKIRLTERLAEIDWLITEGQGALASGNFEAAREHFNSALTLTVKLSTFISASHKFNHGILNDLLEGESHSGRDGEED